MSIKKGDRVQVDGGRCGEVIEVLPDRERGILVVFNEDVIWDAFTPDEVKVVPKQDLGRTFEVESPECCLFREQSWHDDTNKCCLGDYGGEPQQCENDFDFPAHCPLCNGGVDVRRKKLEDGKDTQ